MHISQNYDLTAMLQNINEFLTYRLHKVAKCTNSIEYLNAYIYKNQGIYMYTSKKTLNKYKTLYTNSLTQYTRYYINLINCSR